MKQPREVGDLLPIERIVVVSAVLWTVAVPALMLSGYFGIQFTTAISYKVDDGWCDTITNGVGFHCFGDFGAPRQNFGFPNYFDSGNRFINNTPVVILLFKALGLIPYEVGLLLVQSVLLVSFVSVWVHCTKKLNLPLRFITLFVVFVGTTGFVSGIDRSNWAILLVPLFYFQVLSIEAGHWKQSSLLAASIVSIKYWGILFFLPLLWKKRYAEAFLGLLLAGLVNWVALLFFPETMLSKIGALVRGVIDRDLGAEYSKYSVSIFGLVSRLQCIIKSDECRVIGPSSAIPYSTAIAIGLLTAILLWSFVIFRKLYKQSNILALLPLGTVAFLGVPEAAPYNLSFASAIAALLIVEYTQDERRSNAQPSMLFIVALAAALVPVPIILDPELAFGTELASRIGIWRFASLSVPLIWSGVIGMSIFKLWTSKGASNSVPF